MAEDEESRNYYCDVIMDEAGKMNKMVKTAPDPDRPLNSATTCR